MPSEDFWQVVPPDVPLPLLSSGLPLLLQFHRVLCRGVQVWGIDLYSGNGEEQISCQALLEPISDKSKEMFNHN